MKYETIVLIGSGKIACDCLNCLSHYTSKIEAVEYTEDCSLSFFKHLCVGKKVGYYGTGSKSELSNYLKQVDKKTLIISANNNYIFSRELLKMDNIDIINFHNSLLPNYPGRNAPTWAIFDQQHYTGVTWHLVDDGLDTGKVIAQETISISDSITAIELAKQCMDVGIKLFSKIVPEILYGDVASVVQDTRQRLNFHQAREIPNGGIFDLSWTIEKMSAFLHSLDYGKIKIFPKPCVRLFNTQFSVKCYKIETISQSVDYPSVILNNNLLQIISGNRLIKIVLDKEN